MKCPVCRSLENIATSLHAEGFEENITECRVCGASWAVNHGMTEVIRDPQERSFLEAVSERVESDDYGLAS